MIKVKTSTFFAIGTLLLTFTSVNLWAQIPLGNLITTTFLQLIVIYLIYKKRNYLFTPVNKNIYLPVTLYLTWTYICIIRGSAIADNYFEYKQLLIGSISCLLPIMVWLFYKPYITYKIYSYWFKYGILFFIIFYWWNAGFTQFYLSPLLLLFCFFPLFPPKKALIIFIIGILYCYLGGIENRSQLIKGVCALAIGGASYIMPYLSKKIIKIGHILCYATIFIIFKVILWNANGVINGNISVEEAKYGSDSELTQDSRSLIYADVITSAINHNYVIWGRTPARGNDIELSYALFFWAYDDNVVFNKNERHSNEVLHLNIFTWEGLIGVILYFAIYIKASYLAVYRSKNIYISLLGCFIAFRWVFGWIEDFNSFNILNISLWTMIGMCYSDKFRDMTNIEFKQWIRKLI